MREKLKILHIAPGGIEIPPKGWGAVEKIIWNYKTQFEKMGHQFDVGFPWDINKDNYDIIHVHMANQAIDDLYKNNKKYIFSLHDHHVLLYKKESKLFNDNLNAIKKSIISLSHAEYIIDFFDSTDKLFFIEHGVDTSFYIDKNIKKEKHSLLCVGKNGLINVPDHDRKGFRIAIESAKELDIPITIAGPESNKTFFNANKDLLEYDKLNIIYNPDQDELVDIYNNHTMFIHPSNLEAGHPNLTILEALSCGLPVIGTYKGDNLDGLIKCELNKDDVCNKINYTINNYDKIKESTKEISKYDWKNVSKKLEQIYYNVKDIKLNFTSDKMRDKIIEAYENTEIKYKKPNIPSTKFSIDFQDSAKVTIHSIINNDKKYKVDFIDKDKNKLVYSSTIKPSQWTKVNNEYYVNWLIKILDIDNDQEYKLEFDLTNKDVYIEINTDNMEHLNPWMDVIDEFRKKHNCVIYCHIKNDLEINNLKNKYKNINFIDNPYNIGSKIYYTKYKIGYTDNRNINPYGDTGIKIANDILNI